MDFVCTNPSGRSCGRSCYPDPHQHPSLHYRFPMARSLLPLTACLTRMEFPKLCVLPASVRDEPPVCRVG